MRTSIRVPYALPVITGADLARDAAADFENFFLPQHEVKVRIEVNDTNVAVTRGTGDRVRIVISRGMAAEVIDSPEKLYFHLFIIGHEIAHVVHLHNEGPEQTKNEYYALEMWADFYGAKTMMCLVTYGQRVRAVHRSFFPFPAFERPLEAMGNAAARLVTQVYIPHPLYPFPLLRVGLLTNGIHSFMRRELENAPSIWPYSIFRRMFAPSPIRSLMRAHPEHMEENFEPIERAREWHLKMQGDRIAIAPWLKPQVVHHLHTSFQQTPAEREHSYQTRVRELQEAGLLQDD